MSETLALERRRRPSGEAALERLQAATRVLGLEQKNKSCIRPRELSEERTLTNLAQGDVLLMVLEQLSKDQDKVNLITTSRGVLAEQRRLRPTTAYRKRVSLEMLVGARKAGWRVAHCLVDKRSGGWVTSNQSDNVLAELEVLSIIGRPDCALLVLSPFTDLASMRRLTVFELDSCAIGNAGVGVLSAAFRNGGLQALEVLDLRRNQIGDGGAQALATALSHRREHNETAMLGRLHTLGARHLSPWLFLGRVARVPSVMWPR